MTSVCWSQDGRHIVTLVERREWQSPGVYQDGHNIPPIVPGTSIPPLCWYEDEYYHQLVPIRACHTSTGTSTSALVLTWYQYERVTRLLVPVRACYPPTGTSTSVLPAYWYQGERRTQRSWIPASVLILMLAASVARTVSFTDCIRFWAFTDQHVGGLLVLLGTCRTPRTE